MLSTKCFSRCSPPPQLIAPVATKIFLAVLKNVVLLSKHTGENPGTYSRPVGEGGEQKAYTNNPLLCAMQNRVTLHTFRHVGFGDSNLS